MNRTVRTSAVTLGLAGLLAVGLGAANAQTPLTRHGAPSVATATDTTLAKTLTFNREEERMARDLYAAIADLYDGARPFSMITRSEQGHFDAVGRLLETYGIADPSSGRTAGSYADPTLQKLYDGWLADAKKSLDAAYQAGIQLEQRDIADLETSIAGSTRTDVDAVLGNLRNASTRHLTAFQAAAKGDLPEAGGYGRGRSQGQGPGAGMGAGNGIGRHGGTGGNGPMGSRTGDCPYATAT
jgi:hypothetical protein